MDSQGLGGITAGVPSGEQQPSEARLSHMGTGYQLLELPVQIDQTKILALLDCRATHILISSRLVEKLQQQASIGPSLTVTMANTLMVMTEKFVTVPLQFRPSYRKLSLQILPDLSTPIILKMQFLETVNPMVDQVNKSVAQMDNGG